MITLKEKQEIIMMHVREGRSIREISRVTGLHRKTVTRYVRTYEESRAKLVQQDPSIDIFALTNEIIEKPTYKKRIRTYRKMTTEMEEQVKQHLAENEVKMKNGQRKQVKKAIDIYESLTEQGANISYSTIRRIVCRLKTNTQEAFIKMEYTPGDVCEFDWGNVTLTVDGVEKKYELAVFTSAFGNFRYAKVYTKQKTEHFQEAHASFFDHIGGVYRTMVYDNMRVAVASFVGQEKHPTEALSQLSLYYGFEFRFCNAYRGNEKGHVERSVDVIRRKAFSHRSDFKSIEEVNAYLLEICNKQNEKKQVSRNDETANMRLKQELSHMLPWVPKLDASRKRVLRVDKYATVAVELNRYSVPDHLVGKQLMIKVHVDYIRCYDEGVLVAEHLRCNGVHEWRLKLEHYLSTLNKKPGALATSTALHQAQNKIKEIYGLYYTTQPRAFIDLLCWTKAQHISLDQVEQSIAQLVRIHPTHVTTDKIKVVHARMNEPLPQPITPSQQTKDIEEHAKHHLIAYQALLTSRADESGGVA